MTGTAPDQAQSSAAAAAPRGGDGSSLAVAEWAYFEGPAGPLRAGHGQHRDPRPELRDRDLRGGPRLSPARRIAGASCSRSSTTSASCATGACFGRRHPNRRSSWSRSRVSCSDGTGSPRTCTSARSCTSRRNPFGSSSPGWRIGSRSTPSPWATTCPPMACASPFPPGNA